MYAKNRSIERNSPIALDLAGQMLGSKEWLGEDDGRRKQGNEKQILTYLNVSTAIW